MANNFKTLCVILIIFMIFESTSAEEDSYVDSDSLGNLAVRNYLPSRKDFRLYFSSINRLLNFISRNRYSLDFGMKFALFLLNVNLRPFLKKTAIPTRLRNHLKRLLDQSDKLQRYYTKQLAAYKHSQPNYYTIIKMYVSMLENEAQWSKLLIKMNLDLVRKTRLQYNYAIPDWDKFEIAVDDLYKWMPNPNSSVTCFSSLSQNKKERLNKDKPCRLAQECVEMFDFRTNYGYAVTFRMIFLLLARLSRGCTIFSTVQDEYMRTQLCVGAYKEAEFIVKNGYRKVELLLEQIALCSLQGHAQFLRRSWLSNCLRFQTPYGYFSNTIYNSQEKEQDKLQMEMEYIESVNNISLQHINDVAISALSAALRYILEQYY